MSNKSLSYLIVIGLLFAIFNYFFLDPNPQEVEEKTEEIEVVKKVEKVKETKPPKKCPAKNIELQRALNQFSIEIENAEIRYNSEPLSDCSGMFKRVVDHLEKELNCHAYKFPPRNSSRGNAVWYHQHQDLTIIKNAADARAKAHLIKPGAVMFFGQQNRKYNNPSIKELGANKTGIEHMGIVTEVYKNEGQIVGYSMFHGRSGKKIAKRTDANKINHVEYPFGNYDQQWVGIAYVLANK